MNDQPEFSYIVNCGTIKETEKNYRIEASESQCAALAKRFGLLKLENLKANADVSRQSSDLVRLRCEFSAKIIQECIVTLKPLESNVNSSFVRSFSATAKPYYGEETQPEGEGVYDISGAAGDRVEAPEPPDSMIDGGFDLGETVAEQLLLEIAPFPRSTDASFDGFSSSGEDGEGKKAQSPFAVLEQLKKKS